MKKVYTIKNTFHGTEVSLMLDAATVDRNSGDLCDLYNYGLTDGQKRKAIRALCPSHANGCTCGAMGNHCEIGQ